MPPKSPSVPPRDNLVRAVYPAVELRANEDDPSGMPTLEGHFAKFNEWTEIDSLWEGRFMERIAPGAFRKTLEENRDRMRILFQHGQDPQIGDKPLAPIDDVGEDDEGGFYRGKMLDTSYNRDLVPGLQAGQYGSSFRFSVVKEELNTKPKRSAYNPDGLPERTVKEARVFEFGPVTFPAYAGATAGVRSLTDVYTLKRFVREPEKLGELLEAMRAEALPGAGDSHSAEGSRQDTPAPAKEPEAIHPPTPQQEQKTMTIEEREARQTEIRSRLNAIDAEYAGEALPGPVDEEFRKLNDEFDENAKVLKQVEERRARLEQIAADPNPYRAVDRPGYEAPQVLVRKNQHDIYDLARKRAIARTPEDEVQLNKDDAKRAVEIARFPGVKREVAQERVTSLLDSADDEQGTIARRVLLTGSPQYDRAFGKAVMGQPLSNEESSALSRAMSLTGSAGGYEVPFDLDPTVIGTSNGSVNPWRQIARVVQITGDEWRGVSSGAITTAYAAEATETTDNSPTLAQPTISTEKAQAFIPFSIEIGMDWGGLRGELGNLLQESKDDLEASKFATGSGTNEPFGVITGATNTVNATTGQTFDLGDLYALEEALPPRYRARASLVGNRSIFNLVRQFDTNGGAALWIRVGDGLANGGRLGQALLGYPTFEASAMASGTTTGSKFLLLGDFSRFVIVDRVGLSIELIPHLFGSNQRPTGQRGLYAFWRNGSKVVDANAFRVLLGIA